MAPVPARLRTFSARVLPRGWPDLLRQIVLFCGAYWLYRIVRGLVDGRAAEALANAREIVALEQGLHAFFEPHVQAFAEAHRVLVDLASWTYVNSHFVVTTITLAWIYLRRNERFYFVRNMFMVAMGIALVLYVLYPTAPPRFLPELGFTDSVAHFTGARPDSGLERLLFNPYAAVPSMHVCFALMLGLPVARMMRRRWAAAVWRLYPLVITWAVLTTANHWWMDAVLGALTAAVSAAFAAGFFARVRPDAWAWDRAPATAGA
jgi:membrane-associated phospholipid phosphatase